MDRKAELERKKAKLAAIREEKERRRREKEAKDMEDATNKIVSGQEKDSRRYVDSSPTYKIPKKKKKLLIYLSIFPRG